MVAEGGSVAWVGSEGAADGLRRRRRRDRRPGRRAGHPGVHRRARAPHLDRPRPHRPRPVGRRRPRRRAGPDPYRPRPARRADGCCSGTAGTPAAGPERRPPTRAELDAAAGSRAAYLVADRRPLRAGDHRPAATGCRGCAERTATTPTGRSPATPTTRCGRRARRHRRRRQRRAAQRAALRARRRPLGIGSIHECAGPEISGEDDLTGLLALAAEEPGPRVFGYWARGRGRPRRTPGPGPRPRARSARQATCSSTARSARTPPACTQPYADAPHTGTAYLTPRQIAAHVAACTRGRPPGRLPRHRRRGASPPSPTACGPPPSGWASTGYAPHGTGSSTPRCSPPATVAAFAELGLTASVQPAFDAAWGGAEGMYAAPARR